MPFIPVIAEKLKKRLKYLLRATFDAANQGYTNGQVLDTVAEGVQDGQHTVVEVDGTLAIVSNQCAFTAQGTPAWGDQGFYSQAIEGALGRGLLAEVNADLANKPGPMVGFHDAASANITNRLWTWYIDFSFTNDFTASVVDGAGSSLEAVPLVDGAVSTDYKLALVLGGFHSNGVAYKAGDTRADFGYGAAWFIQGGTFASWTLLWRTALLNNSTIYAAANNHSQIFTLDNFRVPDADLSAVLQPAALSTFTAANGTSLDAISPEVGGAWTEQAEDFDIQGNKASTVNDSQTAEATIDAGIADILVDTTVNMAHNVGTSSNGLLLRFTDPTHFWWLGINPDGNTFKMYEYNGGLVERASVAVTIDPATDYAVRGIADGQTIAGFVGGGNKISYGSAAFNETVTVHGIMGYQDGSSNKTTHNNFTVMPRTSSVYDSVLDSH